MFEKISVKGKDRHPLYEWLEEKSGKAPSWNFCKYFVDETGEKVLFFPSSTNPMSEEIIRLL
jgi:glutathione peroxidase